MRSKKFSGLIAAVLLMFGGGPVRAGAFGVAGLDETAEGVPMAAANGHTQKTLAAANEFFQAIARKALRGFYPRYFYGEQSYFTVVGADDSDREGLLNEDAALEVDKGGFSIEPFLYLRDRLVTWNDVVPTQELDRGYLPVPTVTWRRQAIVLKTTAFAASRGEPALYVRYRVENQGSEPEPVRLFLAIRPFQVNPPWQSLNMTGGVSPIHAIAYDGRAIRLDGSRTVVPLAPPDRFGALALGRPELMDHLSAGKVPHGAEAHDPSGFASAAMAYDLALPPGGARDIYVAIPYGEPERLLRAIDPVAAEAFGRDRLRETIGYWESRLARAELIVPPEAQKLHDTVRSNLAYIFIHRDGPAFYPGSRTYARSWIRDAAGIGSALLGMGYPDEVRRFLRWYQGFQFPEGKIPCCVDSRGPDSVPENDSQGEFIAGVAEYYRYTRDRGFVREMWPAVVKAVGYVEALRKQRMTEEYRSPAKRLFFGLVPDSISHEGYASRPVHSFWDGFWTLRGLKDAVDLAEAVQDEGHAGRFRRLRDEFRGDLYASLDGTMARHRIAFLPGSVELGDFDSNATAMIVNVAGEEANLPPAALRKTLDQSWDHFRKRREQTIEWDAYTPYELRMVETLVRLGRREQASELLTYLLAGQRPSAWNGWAEVVWRDAQSPRFLGDMPHAWVGAEFVRAVRSLFAYERESDRALVLAAGIPAAWLAGETGVGVAHLPTWFGTLSYRLERQAPDELHLKLSGDLTLPPGKILVRAPSEGPLQAVTVNGRPSTIFTENEAVVGEFPADVVLKYGPVPTTKGD